MRIEAKLTSIIALVIIMVLPLSVFSQTLEDAQKAYNAGIAANSEGNVEEAISQFNKCIEACEYLVDMEEDETAEELLYNVQAVVPKLYYQLGTTQLTNNEIEKGIENINKAKKVAGEYGDTETEEKATKVIPQIYYKLAASKYKADKLDDAISDLDKSIAADADYSPAYYLKAVTYKKKGDDETFKKTALEGIAAAKRSNDRKMESRITELGLKHFLKLGNDAQGAAKYGEAVGYLNSALEFDENDVTALFLLTTTYNSKGDYNDAISTGEKAVAAETGGPEAQAKIYLIIAEAYAKKGDNSAACSAYRKAAVGEYQEHAEYQIKHVLKCEE